MVASGSVAIVEQEKYSGEPLRGETIRFLKDFDLFGHNINGLTGIIVRLDSGRGKPLVVVDEIGEWIEPEEDTYERIAPGHVTEEATDFLKLVIKLGSK